MLTKDIYAQLSAHVYARTRVNTMPVPAGWTEIVPTTDSITGFSAGVYKNGSDVVIAFTGTNEIFDWATNIGAATGLGGVQLGQAVALVFETMLTNPGANITFTGHSLGAGLASLMAVFFNRSATVFDVAPFELTALNPLLLQLLKPIAAVISAATGDNAFADYVAPGGMLSFLSRQAKVTGYFAKGEALEKLRAVMPYITGSNSPIEDGNPLDVSAIQLHSITLLQALEASSAFKAAVVAQPHLLSVLFDTKLYASADMRGSDTIDVFTRMLIQQLGDPGNGIVPNGILDTLAADLQKFKDAPDANDDALVKGVLSTLAEYYRFASGSSIDPFLDKITGGVQFDATKISSESDHAGIKVLQKLIQKLVDKAHVTLPDLNSIERYALVMNHEALVSKAPADAKSDLMLGDQKDDSLKGGDGNDVLIGGAGNDTLDGGEGNDTLVGGANKNTLKGGNGNDDYYVSFNGPSVIQDEDGKGSVTVGISFDFGTASQPKLLKGGKQDDGSSIWKSADGQISYYRGEALDVPGELLVVAKDGSRTLIKDWKQDDLGIHLDEEKKPSKGSERKKTNQGSVTTSPLILDLDGDGVETLGTDQGVRFDFDNNSFSQLTGWVGKDDGLLVLDRNGNGLIDSGAELFGTNTILSSGLNAQNGFAALREFDSNGDWQISSADAAYTQIKIWQDGNSNGKVDAGELKSLAEANVKSIGTAFAVAASTPENLAENIDTNSNLHWQAGSYTKVDGDTAAIQDVWFAVDRDNATEYDPLALSEEIAALPDLAGSGNMRSLHQAMAHDPSGHIKTLLEQYLADTNPLTRRSALVNLVYAWAGVESVDPGSRAARMIYGNAIGDARSLAALEAWLGEPYMGTWCWLERDPNPHGKAAPFLKTAFDEMLFQFEIDLAEQIPGHNALVGSVSIDEENVGLDFSRLDGQLQAQIAADPVMGMTTLLQLWHTDGRALSAIGWQGASLIASSISSLPRTPELLAVYAAAGVSFSGSKVVFENLVFGGNGDDRIVSSDDDERLFGGLGDDTLMAGAGQDIVSGGDGNDSLDGQAGDDTLYGDLGADFLYGGAGQDVLLGGEGVDCLLGNEGDDVLLGEGGSDVLAGGNGKDSLLGGDGRDWLYGDYGNDELDGGEDDDYLHGGAGEDTLIGGAGDDVLADNTERNVFVFGRGDGHDKITSEGWGSLNASILQLRDLRPEEIIATKKPNNDLLLTVATSGESVTVVGYFAWVGNMLGDIVFDDGTHWLASDIHQFVLHGTQNNDSIIGFASDDLITGNDGADTLWGGAGNDTLSGDAGADLLSGEAGNDVMSGGADADRLYGDAGKDSLNGGSGNDRLVGGDDDDVLAGGAGDDHLEGGWGGDTYLFGRGDGHDEVLEFGFDTDRVVFADDVTPDDILVRRVNDYDVVLTIRNTGDSLTVRSGLWDAYYAVDIAQFADGTIWDIDAMKAQSLLGTDLDDRIEGGGDNDEIDGGSGNDLLLGGYGNDTYIFGIGSGQDIIDDGQDANSVRFKPGVEPNGLDYSMVGKDLLLTIRDSGDSLLVLNWTLGKGVELLRFDGGAVLSRADVETFLGLSSDDALIFGTSGADVINTTNANTTVHALGGGDTITGGTGNDTVFGDVGNDLLSGGAGQDVLYGAEGDDTLDAGSGMDGGYDELYGGSGDDDLRGGADADLMTGDEGNDLLNAGAGDDDLDGGDGNDVLLGGAGRDFLSGDSGDDTLDGGADRDGLRGGAGHNRYVLSPGSGLDEVLLSDASFGDDTVIFAPGVTPDQVSVQLGNPTGYVDEGYVGWREMVVSLGGNDALIINKGNWSDLGQTSLHRFEFSDGTVLTLEEMVARADGGIEGDRNGSDGADTLIGSNADDSIVAAKGEDVVIARDNDDGVFGRGGNDTLDGGDGNDDLQGGFGDDVVRGGAGDDLLSTGEGSNVFLFNRGDGHDTIDLGDRVPSGFVRDAADVDTLSLGGGVSLVDLSIYAEAHSLVIALDGGAGGRVVLGELGVDDAGVAKVGLVDRLQIVDADGGVRVFDLRAWATAYISTLLSSAASLPISLDGMLNDYELTGGVTPAGGYRALAYGQTGDLFGSVTYAGGNAPSSGNDQLIGTVNDDSLAGLTGDDVLVGDAGVDSLDGGAGNDVIDGGNGSDTLLGGAGDDKLYGGDGNDLIDAGGGNDYAAGGRGGDTYVYRNGDGRLTIDDKHKLLEYFRSEGGYGGGYGGGDYDLVPNILSFGPGIRYEDLRFSELDGDLIVDTGVDGDRIRLVGYDPTRATLTRSIDEFRFDDGESVSANPADVAVLREGGVYDDYLWGSEENDVIKGNAGNDILLAQRGNDYLIGGDGDDSYQFYAWDYGVKTIEDISLPGAENKIELLGGITPDDIVGVSYGVLGLQINLSTGLQLRFPGFDPRQPEMPPPVAVFEFSDGSVLSFKEVLATYSDEIVGTSEIDVLHGTDGDDRIRGLAGNDTLAGGAGNDRYLLSEGEGEDTISDVASPDAGNTVVFPDSVDPASIRLSYDSDSGELIVSSPSSGNVLRLEGFDPNAPLGARTVEFFQFAEGVLTYEQLLARGFDIEGGDGNDFLPGTALVDRINGGAESDLVQGMAGDDVLSGGTGDDVYVFNLGDGVDVLRDTGADINTIAFGDGITGDDVSFEVVGTTLVVHYGALGDEIHIENYEVGGVKVVDQFMFSDGNNYSRLNLANTAPQVATGVADVATDEDATFSFTVPTSAFADLDAGDALGFTAEQSNGNALPAWMHFDAASKTFSGTPRNDDVGFVDVRVTAFDTSGAAISDVFRITVNNTSDAPVAVVDVASATEDVVVLTTASTGVLNNDTDVDVGDTRTVATFAFGTTSAAVGSTLSGTYGSLTLNADGSYNYLANQAAAEALGTGQTVGEVFGYTMQDAAGAAGSSTLGFTITGANDAPVLSTAIADQVSNEDAAFSFVMPVASFIDIDANDTLAYSATLADGNALPTWLSFDPATRLFSGTPRNADVGFVDVRVVASDTSGAMASDVFRITVNNTNDAPVLVTLAPDLSIYENAFVSYAVPVDAFTDMDFGDVLSYSAKLSTGAALPAWLSFDPVARTLSGKAPFASAGTLSIRITATDISGAFASDDLLLAVARIPGAIYGTNSQQEGLNGTAGADILVGLGGYDYLDGGAGGDTMAGGTEGDEYIVDNAGDLVVEYAGEGIDTINASTSYTLVENVENLRLTGTAVLGTGNVLNNQITGNALANVLRGEAGNDTLDGGAGVDSLFGGIGDDTYIVGIGDVVTENADEGVDTVQSSVSYILGENVENLMLSDYSAINGTGNTLANMLTGNTAANTLAGGEGNDTLNGGAGSDVLIGGNGNDTYVLGRSYGADLIRENDSTSGNIDVLQANSNVAANQLWFAQSGNDLVVSIIGTSDKSVIENWYSGGQYHVEQFKSGNGKILLDSQVDNLVSAMAAFAPPGAGQTTLPASYQSSLNPVIAANWH
ncbi:MAG: putative outer rane adhesin like protein [Rhodocyclales bacterium]|nr:putative outer rane adhesin like protein [Rhodocyclales bacterium]